MFETSARDAMNMNGMVKTLPKLNVDTSDVRARKRRNKLQSRHSTDKLSISKHSSGPFLPNIPGSFQRSSGSDLSKLKHVDSDLSTYATKENQDWYLDSVSTTVARKDKQGVGRYVIASLHIS